ncbi:DUF3224 domain-containing protein [Pseudomonas sp. NBRC 111132]|uniref:DUF3224 domain-containing protein n=1 Tax=Pseudomonas sp. NBRC 111132 TaxID=1661047 RepID=UPI0007619102|nr:DUF3224 domain-containing protein [Pseudomonas sp. NBRC 111132]
MQQTAVGSFDITLNPQPLSRATEKSGLGRLSLDKQFKGDLDATSQGEMLSFRSSVPGSAGYVETVQGTLHGRSGSFVLQHSSTMNRGAPVQSITVVPDSGTDALSGLTGSMVTTITDRHHSYKFEYMLPDQS